MRGRYLLTLIVIAGCGHAQVGSSASHSAPRPIMAAHVDIPSSGGGGAVSSVTAAAGCATISPMTGAVVIDTSGCAAASYTVNASTITAPDLLFTKSRGTAGTPTAVLNTDYISTVTAKGYSGTSYISSGRSGWMVTPGGTIDATHVPMDYYIDEVDTGIGSDPKGSAHKLPFRIGHQGTVALQFDASIGDFSFEGIAGDTAALNIFHPVGAVQNAIAVWVNNSAATPVASYIEHAGWIVNTAGSEVGQMIVEVNAGGNYIIAEKISGTAAGTAQVQYHLGSATSPGLSWNVDNTSGWYLTTGSGPDYDEHLSIAGIASYDFLETGTAGNLAHIIRAHSTGTGDGGFEVGPGANHSGLFTDHVSGGIYLESNQSTVAIGAPGAQATNATSGFLGVNSMAGQPTATPANLTTGKVPVVVDTTNKKFMLSAGGSTWYAANRYTRGSDVASASSIVPSQSWALNHVTGTTTINCVTTTGFDDGDEFYFYFVSAVTVKNAQTCAGADKAFQLVGAADASMSAGSGIRVYYDSALGTIREMERTAP
jgi:hypothetical protein